MLEDQGEHISIWKRGRATHRANLGYVFEDITTEINRFSAHEEINDFQGFGIDTVNEVRFRQKGVNNHIIE